MLETHAIKRRDGLLFVLILFVAALMRFGQMDIVEYFHDDGMLATLAQEIIRGDQWHWTGIISSVGIPNPPMSIYVLLPAFALSLDPIGAILFIMAWNVFGVGVLWWIAQRYFGRTTALITGLAYALSPWAIFYSRKLWAQDYHTPFVLLAIALGLYGFIETKHSRWQAFAQIITAPILLVGMQIHFAGWVLLPVYGALLYLGKRQIQWRMLFISALISALVVLPYGIGLVQTLQSDPTRISDALSRSEATEGVQIGGEALTYWAMLTTGLGLETWVAPVQHEEMLNEVPPISLGWLMIPLLISGMMVIILRQPYRRFIGLLCLWGFLPFLIFLPNWTPTYPHYFVASIPALMLLIGIGTGWVARIVPSQPNGRMIILVAFAVVAFSQAIWWRGALRYLNTEHIEYPGFTTPLSYLLPIREAMRDYEQVVVVSQGMAWDRHHEAVVWNTLLANDVSCVQTLQGDGYAVIPQQPFAVLVAPDAPDNAIKGYYQRQEDIQEFPQRNGGEPYQLITYEQAPLWDTTFISLETSAQFMNGVRLDAYAYENDQLTLRWTLPQGKRGENYQMSAQFFDAEDQRLAQVDRVFWQGQHWCNGDTLLTWVTMPPAEKATTLYISLYTLGTGADEGLFFNVDVVDANNNPVGQAVEIQLD